MKKTSALKSAACNNWMITVQTKVHVYIYMLASYIHQSVYARLVVKIAGSMRSLLHEIIGLVSYQWSNGLTKLKFLCRV